MPKIIICEDDPMISEIYEKKFSEEGFDVSLAVSGDQVLNLAKKEKVDVVLLDLIMPKMSGFEVIEKLRSGQFDPGIKIIVFSNLSQPEDREKALKMGAGGFITKSDFSPTGLVTEVKRIIEESDQEDINEKRLNGNAEGSGVSKGKILIIEDEEVFIEMFGEKLKQDGYEVVSSTNGAWGLKEALKGGYDLFVIDMVMPAMGGDEIIPRLKLEEQTKNIPIIVLTASVDDQTAQKVREMGVDDFYIKTQIIPSELSSKVDELLKK